MPLWIPIHFWRAQRSRTSWQEFCEAMAAVCPCVVIADDHVSLADLLGELARSFGFEACVCYDGESARQLIADRRPEVALLDVSMPGLGGLELASWLRGEPYGQTVRLLAFTGHSSADEQQALRAAGFDEVLLKPLGVETLRRALLPRVLP